MIDLFILTLINASVSALLCLGFMLFILSRDNFRDDDRIISLVYRHNLEASHWAQERGKLNEQINDLYRELNRLRSALSSPFVDPSSDNTPPEVNE